MTRRELLQLLVGQAKEHGFAFRKWFATNVDIPWSGAAHALDWLARGERVTILIFSHEFARHFWPEDERITYVVPKQTFERVVPAGGHRVVERKAHLRKSSREGVWRFHLKEMAAAAQPLRYIRRFLLVEEAVEEASQPHTGEDFDYDEELIVREAD